MPAPGDTDVKFGRSYVFLNPIPEGETIPSPGTVGTWRLNIDDDIVNGGDDGGDVIGSAGTIALSQFAAPSKKGQLLYVNSSGFALQAIATSEETSAVIGVAVDEVQPGETVTYARNLLIDVFTPVEIIEDDLGNGLLAPGKKYFLSSTAAGMFTTTPDTSTPGKFVVECGMATDFNKMMVEIQSSTQVN